jgi:hypothetical protein
MHARTHAWTRAYTRGIDVRLVYSKAAMKQWLEP